MLNETAAWLVATLKGETAFNGFEGRVFPDAAPEEAPNPCLIYQFVGDDSEDLLDAGAATRGTLAFQVRIYASSRAGANALREAFRLRFQGLEPIAIGGGWWIEGSAWGNLPDTYESETKDYGALGVVEFHVVKR